MKKNGYCLKPRLPVFFGLKFGDFKEQKFNYERKVESAKNVRIIFFKVMHQPGKMYHST
jgi:hypothetical protein